MKRLRVRRLNHFVQPVVNEVRALPDAFKKGTRPDFDTVRIVTNPEMASVLANQRKQASEQRNAVISKSKAKRFRKKYSA